MFKIDLKTITKLDKFKDLQKTLEKISHQEVLIGVPDTKTERKAGEAASNAELAYIHEHGAPMQNIPQREFLQPSIEHNIDKINAQQKKVLEIGLENKSTQSELNKLGLLGQSIVKNWFTDSNNGWEPNTPETIKRKKSDKPLIDTAQLLNSITYVIRDNK